MARIYYRPERKAIKPKAKGKTPKVTPALPKSQVMEGASPSDYTSLWQYLNELTTYQRRVYGDLLKVAKTNRIPGAEALSLDTLRTMYQSGV